MRPSASRPHLPCSAWWERLLEAGHYSPGVNNLSCGQLHKNTASSTGHRGGGGLAMVPVLGSIVGSWRLAAGGKGSLLLAQPSRAQSMDYR